MSYHFKARAVYYDAKTSVFRNGEELIINANHIVRFQKTDMTNLKRIENMGIVFDVTTVIDTAGYTLRVTSNYLERLMEHTE